MDLSLTTAQLQAIFAGLGFLVSSGMLMAIIKFGRVIVRDVPAIRPLHEAALAAVERSRKEAATAAELLQVALGVARAEVQDVKDEIVDLKDDLVDVKGETRSAHARLDAHDRLLVTRS